MTVVARKKSLSSRIYLYALTAFLLVITFLLISNLLARDDIARFATVYAILALVVLHCVESIRIYKRSKWVGKSTVAILVGLAALCALVALLTIDMQALPSY